jgi:hypothetical protein
MRPEDRIVGEETATTQGGRLTIVVDYEAAPVIRFEGLPEDVERFFEWFYVNEHRRRLIVEALLASGMSPEELSEWAWQDIEAAPD